MVLVPRGCRKTPPPQCQTIIISSAFVKRKHESAWCFMLAFMSPSVLSCISFSFPFTSVFFLIPNSIPRLKDREMERSDMNLVVVRPYLPDFNHAFIPCFLSFLLLLVWSMYCMQFYCLLYILTMEIFDMYLNSLLKCKLYHLHFGFLVSFFAPCLHASLAPCWAASIIFIAQSLSLQPLFSFHFSPQVQCHGANPPTLISLQPPLCCPQPPTPPSLFLCLSPLKPPSIHSAAWTQCWLFLTQPADRSPELTVSLGLSQCRRAPLCAARGELTPTSEPNE